MFNSTHFNKKNNLKISQNTVIYKNAGFSPRVADRATTLEKLDQIL